MPRDDITPRVVKVVAAQLDAGPDEIHEDSKFQDDLGADSLDVVELVMGLEEEFNIDIPDEDAEKIATVGQAVAYLESQGA